MITNHTDDELRRLEEEGMTQGRFDSDQLPDGYGIVIGTIGGALAWALIVFLLSSLVL